MSEPKASTGRESPVLDELQFVDDDVRAAFEGKQYTAGMALTVQMIREIRSLRGVLLGNAGG